MSFPVHKRYEIVFSHLPPRSPKLGYTEITDAVGCSKSTVGYWINRWKETKDLTDEPRSGCERVTTIKGDKKIVNITVNDENATASKFQQKMKQKGWKLVKTQFCVVYEKQAELAATQSRNHCSPKITERNVRELLWPSMSSNQSPIENVWKLWKLILVEKNSSSWWFGGCIDKRMEESSRAFVRKNLVKVCKIVLRPYLQANGTILCTRIRVYIVLQNKKIIWFALLLRILKLFDHFWRLLYI